MSMISYVIPCYRSEHTIADVVGRIDETQKSHSEYEYEIILVNDSSPDDTFSVLKELAAQHDNITAVDMTRNFGQHAALMAGFHFCRGDIVICLDDDGQTPPEEAFKLVDKLGEGYDVVYARYGKKEHSAFRNFGSKVNSIMTEQMLDKPKELYISSFFAARKFIIEEVLQYKNAYPYVIGLVLRSTKRICNVDVHHEARKEGSSGYSLKKLFALWMNGFTAFSVKPLRIATYTGIGTAIAGIFMLIYVIIKKLSHDPNTPVGWASTMSVLLFMSGMILFVLGIIGEYIGRMYICMNSAPQYVIREVVLSGKDRD
ncbi:MAG: glycosyltransferase family 2 protein [Butyrivibrio sp.]|nr:glycosyltransferase family 2 protein [Butyrivibrio sp.]